MRSNDPYQNSLISPNFDVKLIIFPNFGQGPFPKIAAKSPELFLSWCSSYSSESIYLYMNSLSPSASDKSRPGYQIVYKVEEKRLFSGGVNTLVGQNDASLVSFLTVGILYPDWCN